MEPEKRRKSATAVALGEPTPLVSSNPRLRVAAPPEVESGLDSREGIIARLKEVCADPETKQETLLKALRQICEIRGFAAVPDLGEYRTMSNEKLTALMFDVVLVALREFGVRDRCLLGILCPKCKEALREKHAIELDLSITE
jgi:hypothetical protein